ncbi:MAG: hypothetical protein J6B85_07925 [Lachnospiraceae bacterium]|nr:hypothetical protein [Lachnospiraceae bacterium]
MNQKKEEFLAYLQKQKEACLAQARALTEEDRKDESGVYKAKANIYDIFAMLYRGAEKGAAGDEKKLEQVFLKNAETIPQNWNKAYERAKQHQDAARILLEEAKLAAAEDIMVNYKQIIGI